MRITVLGAGAWGTALAASLAQRHDCVLWARDAAQAASLAQTRCNARYLPGIDLPPALRIEAAFDAALAHARTSRGREGLLVVATPTSALREMLGRCAASGSGLWWLCKGFEAGSGAMGHEIARELEATRVGVLSGPSFAIEVAKGRPTALVAASADAALCEQALEAFHGEDVLDRAADLDANRIARGVDAQRVAVKSL